MAKVNVYRFEEEEITEADGTLTLNFTDVRHIARADSAETAIRLLGVSGLREQNAEKHPVVDLCLRAACDHFDLPRPVCFLRGVHGTFVITREDTRRVFDVAPETAVVQ